MIRLSMHRNSLIPSLKRTLAVTGVSACLLGFAARTVDARTYRIRVDFTSDGEEIASWPQICGPHIPVDGSYPPGNRWRYFLRYWPHHVRWQSYDVTAETDKSPAALTREGPFTGGKRWYDFTKPTGRSKNLQAHVAEYHGKGYETSPGFGNRFGSFVRGQPRVAKNLVYWIVRHFNENKIGGNPILHWRFGLEMQGRREAYLPDVDWEKHDRFWDFYAGERVARNYVESLLAPGAEAVEAASRDVYGNPDTVKVVLGTVGCENPAGMRFLDAILDQRLSGKNAPALEGDRMWQHVDFLSVNFFLSTTRYVQILNHLHATYMQTGKVEGIWVTDLGRAGNGAWLVIQTAARFLDWSSGKYTSPHALRLFYWGEGIKQPSGPATDALDYLGDIFQDATIRDHTDAVTFRCGVDLVPERYAFSCGTADSKKHLVAMFPHEKTYPMDFRLEGLGRRKFAAEPRVSVKLWPEDRNAYDIAPDAVERTDDSMNIHFEKSIAEDTLMTILVECE